MLIEARIERCRFMFAVILGLMISSCAWAQLTLEFEDQSSQYDPNQIWVTFDNGGGTTPFDVTYNGGTAVNIAAPGGVPNHLSDPIQLSTVTDYEFTINSVSSVAVFLSYGTPFTTLDASPSFFQGATSADITYQNFEITRTGGTGDQGNLTNINYFTAPLSIRSFSPTVGSGNTPVQSTGFNQSTQQVASRLAALSNSSAVVDGGSLRRYVGPSTYSPGTSVPYNSFENYLSSINTSGVTNTIQNINGFATNGATSNTGETYNFTFSMTSNVNANNDIVLTGDITTEIIDRSNGSSSTGTTYNNANITISGSDMTLLNSMIYGQTSAPTSLQPIVTWGQGWTDWANFVQTPSNNLTDAFPQGLNINELTLPQTAIGEITTAILMGFLGNTTSVNGTPLDTLASEDWWKLDPMQAFDDIQSDPDNYNQWADVIYDASNNGVYSIPFSDRLGTGPLVNTVQFQGHNIDRWIVGFGDPIPEPTTLVLIGVGSVLVLGRRRRNMV